MRWPCEAYECELGSMSSFLLCIPFPPAESMRDFFA